MGCQGSRAIFAICFILPGIAQLPCTSTCPGTFTFSFYYRSIDRFAFFFDVYKPNCWWWEIYESLRRVACTGVLVLFPVNSVLQLNLAIFLQLQGNDIELHR